MKCAHCLVEFHDDERSVPIGTDADGGWVISVRTCPACARYNLRLVNGDPLKILRGSGRIPQDARLSSTLIRPKASGRPPCPPEVPAEIAEDYREACLVLADSPKASAALSRRCLQNMLRSAAGVKHSDLSNEIQQVLDSGHLPSHLAESIDVIRNVGNFAAHPMKSQSTGMIVPVEPEEAEWDLDVLEQLFDFYYVAPAKAAAKKAALNQKLQDAGKPPAK